MIKRTVLAATAASFLSAPAAALTSDIVKYLAKKRPSATLVAADPIELEQCLVRYFTRAIGAPAMVYRDKSTVTVAMVRHFVGGSATFDSSAKPTVVTMRGKDSPDIAKPCVSDQAPSK